MSLFWKPQIHLLSLQKKNLVGIEFRLSSPNSIMRFNPDDSCHSDEGGFSDYNI